MPAAFTVNQQLADPAQRWWELFADSQLNSFIEEALSGNQTLAAHLARIEKAGAQARKAGADFRPTLTGSGGVSHNRSRTDDGLTSATSEKENYSLGLAASYEIDLWGRIRASRQASRLEADAAKEDFYAAAVTVSGEVTERWLAILSQKLQKKLLLQQLEANRTYLDLVELRFRNSLASVLDVLQQKQLLERIQAQIPLVEMEEQQQKNSLAALLGRMPGGVEKIARQELPALVEIPAAGLPVQLLENRPDIKAALKRLEAADQDLAAARADRLPTLRLTGTGSYAADELDLLFDNWILNIGAGLAVPLIDGSRRLAEVEINEAEVRLKLADYRQVVLSAVREVEDGLIRETKIREHLAALNKQLEASQKALEEAQTRYVNGLNDYLPVLTQLLSVQGLEADLIRRQEDLLLARVALYRAIGGSWTDGFPPPVQNK